MITAQRIASVKEYYFSKKLKEIEQLNQQGKAIINLGIGSPDLSPNEQVINTLIDSVQNPKNHSYQSYRGIPSLRKAIVNWYQKTYGVDIDDAEEVLPLMGSKEGIMHISMTYVNPGDEVLIPDPAYPTYEASTKLAGGVTVKYALEEKNQWQPCISSLEKQITPKTKLIWINYPNMPTGSQTDLSVLKKLLALAKKHHLLVVNDNPYSLTLNNKPTSIFQLSDAKDVALELNSLSKSHHMAGWRLGWVVGKKERINEILKFKSNMDSGMFLPIQHAAIAALGLSTNDIQKTNTIYAKRRALVWELLDFLQCSYDRNQVGMFVWAKLPEGEIDAETFSNALLHGSGVFITPGFIFGPSGKNHIRISLCNSEETLKKAMERMKQLMS